MTQPSDWLEQRLEDLRASIPEVDPAEAARLQSEGAVLVDIREADELASGSPVGARRISRSYLELRLPTAVEDPEATVLLLCAGGTRSLLAADDLRRLGYRDARSVRGGFGAWRDEALPIEQLAQPDARLRERYARHLRIPEVGEAGQLRLGQTKVLVIGAGGLGSPAAFYLAAAGIGHLGIVDDDVVDRSNLQRQILHTDRDVGRSKVESAIERLAALNPDVRLTPHRYRLTEANAADTVADYDIVVDGTDNFAARYLINDACVAANKPNVHGSIYRFEGQVSVFWPGAEAFDVPPNRRPCYRCLFPAPPAPGQAPSCAEAGVLGALPGVVGTLMTVETIKLALRIGTPLIGKLLLYDALATSFMTLEQRRVIDCPSCGNR